MQFSDRAHTSCVRRLHFHPFIDVFVKEARIGIEDETISPVQDLHIVVLLPQCKIHIRNRQRLRFGHAPEILRVRLTEGSFDLNARDMIFLQFGGESDIADEKIVRARIAADPPRLAVRQSLVAHDRRI